MPKYYLIVNPMSGHKKGHTILEKIKVVFEEAKIGLVIDISTHKNHPLELAQSKPLDDIDAICVAGGDGTFHEVINGLLKRSDKKKLPIGFIPAGTGNSMMHDLDCLDAVKAVEKIIARQMKKLDIVEISTKEGIIYSFNILGWGMPSTINILAEKLRWMGSIRYDVASLIELLKNRKYNAEIKIDGNILKGPFGMFLACNTKYTGNGMKMAPQAEFDDGFLDILIVKKASRWKLFSLFLKVFKGSHIGDPIIEHYHVKEFGIDTKSQDPLNIDGQNEGFSPFQAKVLPGHLEIFV